MEVSSVIFYDNRGESIEFTSEIESDIDSQFTEEQLSLIREEIFEIKKELDLYKQVRIGGEILGNMMGIENINKIILLSEYIDRIVFKVQSKIK